MPQILVTGPQRSGTTIAARIIAHDLDIEYIDESDVQFNDIPEHCVIQAPFALKCLVELSFIQPNLNFAFMVRDPQDIKKSMERIEWYKDVINDPLFYDKYLAHCQHLWLSCKVLISEERLTELSYNSLRDHPLFIEDRSDFTVRQWQLDNPIGPKTWRHDRHLNRP